MKWLLLVSLIVVVAGCGEEPFSLHDYQLGELLRSYTDQLGPPTGVLCGPAGRGTFIMKWYGHGIFVEVRYRKLTGYSLGEVGFYSEAELQDSPVVRKYIESCR